MVWFDATYKYKKKITVDHTKVSGDEIDFPVLISVTDADLRDEANGGRIKSANGYDIIFTNSAEDTQLKHEIEIYTNTSGLLVYWVKVNSLSSTADTDIYIYYSKGGVVVDPSSTDTWDSSFKLVWHMADLTTSTVRDSTTNGETGTKESANHPVEVAGKFGKGQEFDGSQDYIVSSITLSPDYTVEAWFEPDDVTASNTLLAYGSTITVIGRGVALGFHVNDLYMSNMDDDTEITLGATGLLANGRFDSWADVVDSGINDVDFHLNGASKALDSPGGYWYNDVNALTIGARRNVGAFQFHADGVVDEVRISDSLRSSNWLATTYATQNDPASFMAWDEEQNRDARICGGQFFSLYGTSTTIVFPYPEWGTPDNKITKDVDLLDFWDNDLDTIDKGIDAQPLTIAGTVYRCGAGDWKTNSSITTWLDSIKYAMNNGEEFEINELGYCINGVYIIRNFTFDTIKKSPDYYAWSLTLERVRDI